jgi:hypothetical protein
MGQGDSVNFIIVFSLMKAGHVFFAQPHLTMVSLEPMVQI